MRAALLLLAACSIKQPTSWRPEPKLLVLTASDVRWPLERTLFVGTVHGRMLQLDGGRSIAFDIDLPDGRAAISGVGRVATREEVAAGAVIALTGVMRERDIAAAHVAAYPLVRRDADLSMALAQTTVTAEGIVRERDGGFVLELATTHEPVRLLVTACDGEAEARAQVGKRRQIYGTLTADETLAIGQPTFSGGTRPSSSCR